MALKPLSVRAAAEPQTQPLPGSTWVSVRWLWWPHPISLTPPTASSGSASKPSGKALLAVEMFHCALGWLGLGAQFGPRTAPTVIGRTLGHALTERELRFGLEPTYRVLATFEHDRQARHTLIHRANAVRPWTAA